MCRVCGYVLEPDGVGRNGFGASYDLGVEE